MRTISMDVPIINPLSTQLNLYQLKKKLDQIQDDPSFIYHLVQLLFKAKSLSTCKIIRLYSKTDFWLRQRSTLFTFLRTKETRTFYSRHFFSRTTNPPTRPHTHTHTHIHRQTHTLMMLEGTRVTIEQIQEGPARHARSKGETRAGRCIGRRYGLEKVHMLTHGASIQVRSSSGMRLTRRLSLDWSLKASATTVRRGSHLFSRASLLAIVKDDDDVARQDALLFLSLSLVFWRLLSLPHRVCVSLCVYTIRVQTRGEHFLRTGLWKHTPLRNLSLESATLQRPIGPPLIFTRVLESSCPTRRSEMESIWEKTAESLMEFEAYSRHWKKSGAFLLPFYCRLHSSK